jgi:neutral ceramidase
MARSHIAVALGAALIASLIIAQLVINLGFPTPEFWHSRLDQSYDAVQEMQFLGEKQNGELVDDPSSYLIGVGKADITGYIQQLCLVATVLMQLQTGR